MSRPRHRSSKRQPDTSVATSPIMYGGFSVWMDEDDLCACGEPYVYLGVGPKGKGPRAAVALCPTVGIGALVRQLAGARTLATEAAADDSDPLHSATAVMCDLLAYAFTETFPGRSPDFSDPMIFGERKAGLHFTDDGGYECIITVTELSPSERGSRESDTVDDEIRERALGLTAQ